MIPFLFKILVVYGALIPLSICLGSFLLKHWVPQFPNKLIPIVNLVVAVICVIVWFPLIKMGYPLELRVFNGVLYGLSSTGLHQIFKQTNEYIRLRKYKKYYDSKRRYNYERNSSK